MKQYFLTALLAVISTFTLEAVEGDPQAQPRRNAAEIEIPSLDSVYFVEPGAPVLTLEDVLKVAFSENIPVKIADREITRSTYAKRGTYAALFPQIDASVGYQRTLEKQVMYMDGTSEGFVSALMPYFSELYGFHGKTPPAPGGGGSNEGMTVGRNNTMNAAIQATMPIVNAQLWKAIKISGQDVELAVEKARGSRLEMATQVKSAFYAVLWAKETVRVYEKVYENAVRNFEVTRSKYACQRASEMDLLRAQTTVANAIPDIYNARNAVVLCLWQLKALMGIEVEYEMDVAGSLGDFANDMFYDVNDPKNYDLSRNTSLKQLDMQLEEMVQTVKMNEMAYVPTLGLAFSYSYGSMANDVKFSEWRWTPYSYIGLTISIPIFSGMRRLNNVKQAKVNLDKLSLTRTQTERNLKVAIRSDLSTMETGMKSYYSALTAVSSAKLSYDISEESYKVGRSTLVELNTAMLALVNAQLSQWQAVYSFLVAKADLEQQLGKDYTAE